MSGLDKLRLNQIILVKKDNYPQQAADGEYNAGAIANGLAIVDDDNVKHYIYGTVQDLASSDKGALAQVKCAETELECSGASVTAAGLFPAKVHQLGVVVRVTEAIAGASAFDVGDGSDADRYGNDIAVALDTKTTQADFTADPRGWSSSAGNVVLTAVTSNFTDGKVRVTAFYIDFTGPLS